MRQTFLAATFFLSGAALASPPAKPHPSEPQIAAIVVAANAVDVEAGELAKAKSANPAVVSFAQQITDHTSVNQSAGALVTKLGVTPEENDSSRGLKDGGEKNLAKLKGLSGAAFDKAYVSHEVDYHVAVLGVIDTVLVPNASNAELKALIVKVRPTIAAHLEHARTLDKTLSK
jgi:putative membrane protein